MADDKDGDKENDAGLRDIDKDLFWTRLGKLHESFSKGGKYWGKSDGSDASVDALVLRFGMKDEETLYDRTLAMNIHLFGSQMTECIMVLTAKKCYFLLSKVKAKKIQACGTTDAKAPGLEVEVLIKQKGDANKEAFATMIKAAKASKGGKMVGVVSKTDAKGKLTGMFQKALEASSLKLVDVSVGYATLLSVKDSSALNATKKAAHVSSQALRKFLLPEIEGIVDEQKKVKHSELADQTDDAIADPKKLKLTMKPEHLESCYTPIIMSGGQYDLKPSAQSNDDHVFYDPNGVVVVSLGARYKGYCSNIARTYFFNPKDDQKEAYSILIAVYQACKQVLKVGNKISKIYTTAMQVIKTRKPEYLDKFTKNCGFGTGLEFRDPFLVCSDKNPRVIEAGMIFNLVVGFSGLEIQDPELAKDPKTKTYAVLLADTFEVTVDDPVALTHAKREFPEVSFNIKGEGEASSSDDEGDDDEMHGQRGVTSDRLRDKKSTDAVSDDLTTNQRLLAKKKHEEALKRFAADNIDNEFNAKKKTTEKFNSYTSPSEFPERAKPTNICVDANSESVLVPIAEQLVPFHVNTIQNVYKTDEAGYTYLRISFISPNNAGPTASKLNDNVPKWADKKSHFIRELTFRTKGPTLNKAFFDIKELRKRVMDRNKEQITKASIVEQAVLIPNRTSDPIKLRDLIMRPNISKKKATGVLVAHTNGFRYITADKQKIDIIYSNIKTAFFQAATQNTIAVLMHFQLKNGILIQKKKKTEYVQFYVEVTDASQDLAQRSRYGDEDGLLEEQEERRRRNRWNERFRQFVKKVEDMLAADKNLPKIEFAIPYKELAFTGVPFRQPVPIIPTVHSLVALDDQPPFVLTLDDIEIANFERVQFSLRNFDLVFVLKDLDKPPVRIDAIPSNFLLPIKQWLNSCDIVFYETASNMLWKNIYKVIKNDPEGFYADGGWSFLSGENQDEGEGDEADASESGSEYSGGSESEDSEEFESEDDMTDEDESAESDWSGAGDEGDEGEDWDEMEKKAKRDDREAAQREKQDADKEERSGGKKRKAPEKSSKPKAKGTPEKSSSNKKAPPKLASKPPSTSSSNKPASSKPSNTKPASSKPASSSSKPSPSSSSKPSKPVKK